MASASRRRRRRTRRTPTVSYRQISYRAVEPARRATRVQTRTKLSNRIKGALSWSDFQRPPLDRLNPLRRNRSSSSLRRKKAVRSISLVSVSPPVRRRGKGGPCVRRPDSRLAALARAGSGSGNKQRYKQDKQERLSRFRVWC